jgi:hypothetical protein
LPPVFKFGGRLSDSIGECDAGGVNEDDGADYEGGKKKIHVFGVIHYTSEVGDAITELPLWVFLPSWSTFNGVTRNLNDSELALPIMGWNFQPFRDW